MTFLGNTTLHFSRQRNKLSNKTTVSTHHRGRTFLSIHPVPLWKRFLLPYPEDECKLSSRNASG